MSSPAATDVQILTTLADLPDPEIGRTLGSLRMLTGAKPAGNGWDIRVELPTPAYPGRERITAAIQNRLASQFPDLGPVTVQFESVTKGKNSGGAIGLRVKNVIAVGSGKGGVGKSTLAASIAYGLKSFGAKVGLLDADVYGPSIPHLVGAAGEPSLKELSGPDGQVIQRLQPIGADGIPMMSIGFMIKPDQAVMWRGPMLHKLLTQFLQQTDWGDLDYLIIDMPPGTGDVAITIAQMVGLAGAVVVCTPQKVALLDAVKAINMYRHVKIPILGIVENMSGDVFGRGGAQAKAVELGIPFLGEVPINAVIREQADEGRISALFSTDNPARSALQTVSQNVAIGIAKSLLESPQMPTLEIL